MRDRDGTGAGAVRAFVAVADELHFGAAADRLGLTQQAISKRIAKLEAGVGATLLRRSRNGTGLTEDGADFLPHARALVALADQATAALRRHARPLRVDVLGTRLAPTELVRTFHEANPDVEIDIVTSRGLRSGRSALVAGTVDVVFARVAGTLDPLPPTSNPTCSWPGASTPCPGDAGSGSPSSRTRSPGCPATSQAASGRTSTLSCDESSGPCCGTGATGTGCRTLISALWHHAPETAPRRRCDGLTDTLGARSGEAPYGGGSSSHASACQVRAVRPKAAPTKDRSVGRDVRPAPHSPAVAPPSPRPAPPSPLTALLPAQASNAAVAAALHSGPEPVLDRLRPTARKGPHADPKFAALKKDVQRKKRTVATSHPPPRTEAVAAQDAARPPRDDEVAQGKAANAEKMNEAKPKEFDKEAFIRAVEDAIQRKAPKNLDQADKFAESNKPAEIKAEVTGRVEEGRTSSAEQIATTTAAPPDTSVAVTKKVVPLAPDRPPGVQATPDPSQAVPDRLPPSATDLSAGPELVNQQLADAQVTEPQLRKANEPTFTKALRQKNKAEQHAEVAQDRLRTDEAAKLKSSTAQAKRLGTAAMGAMAGDRVATGQRVGTGKTGAQGRDEDKRAEVPAGFLGPSSCRRVLVTAILQEVFDTMKTDVENILSGLDRLVDDQFTRGEQAAREAFTAEHQRKMAEYKARRYGDPLGPLRWLDDLFTGLPAEADKIFDDARAGYVSRMRGVISDVADTIGRELGRAKVRIAKGREDLRAEVNKLPPGLRAIGKEAAAEFADQFDELTQTVDEKATELVDTLATRYTDAVKYVDDEIAEEKEKNKGLVDQAVEAVKAVIDNIEELKRLLLGVLAKASQAVRLILTDPIGFLRNLVTGVGAGLRQFMRNIGRHLQQGILSWLLGRTAEAGLQLPAKFDTRGVLLLLAGLLGLTWQAIRARITRRVPEPAVAAAETAVPLVNQVRKQGVAGMWDDLKDRVGDLRKELLDNVIKYVTPTIIIAGITWVLSMLNPASAFIRAVKLIIDIVRFVVTQARQIIEFVNAVLDAVIAIARGATAGVPGLVERALARSIPVLLGFLAAVLGVGGIAARVKQIVQAMARPVGRAVDRVIEKIVGLVRNLWTKLKSTVDRRRPDRQNTRPDKKKPLPRRTRPDRPKPKVKPKAKPKAKTRPPDKRKRPEQNYDRMLEAALRDALDLAEAGMPVEEIERRLPAIRRRHGLTRLTVVVERLQGLRHVIHFVGVVNPMKKTRSVNAELTTLEAREEAGLTVRAQEAFQQYANEYQVIIEVRLTNPESVPHLEAGALFKAREIKPKTINGDDVLLGVPGDKRGLVGFFEDENDPRYPDGRALTSEELAKAEARYRARAEERRKYGDEMRALSAPGRAIRYVVRDYVVHGIIGKGEPIPVAGDHDLYDITTPEGKPLPHAKHQALIENMMQKNFGVMHGTVVNWMDWAVRDVAEWETRRDLIDKAKEEGVIRFAPNQPMRWVLPGTRIWRRPFRGRPPAGG